MVTASPGDSAVAAPRPARLPQHRSINRHPPGLPRSIQRRDKGGAADYLYSLLSHKPIDVCPELAIDPVNCVEVIYSVEFPGYFLPGVEGIPLLVVFVMLGVALATKHFLPLGPKASAFRWLVCISLACASLSENVRIVREKLSNRHLLRSGLATRQEGTIDLRGFADHKLVGEELRFLQSNGKVFRYNSALPAAAYHSPSFRMSLNGEIHHFGPLASGNHVRLWHRDGKILRLDRHKSSCQ